MFLPLLGLGLAALYFLTRGGSSSRDEDGFGGSEGYDTQNFSKETALLADGSVATYAAFTEQGRRMAAFALAQHHVGEPGFAGTGTAIMMVPLIQGHPPDSMDANAYISQWLADTPAEDAAVWLDIGVNQVALVYTTSAGAPPFPFAYLADKSTGWGYDVGEEAA